MPYNGLPPTPHNDYLLRKASTRGRNWGWILRRRTVADIFTVFLTGRCRRTSVLGRLRICSSLGARGIGRLSSSFPFGMCLYSWIFSNARSGFLGLCKWSSLWLPTYVPCSLDNTTHYLAPAVPFPRKLGNIHPGSPKLHALYTKISSKFSTLHLNISSIFKTRTTSLYLSRISHQVSNHLPKFLSEFLQASHPFYQVPFTYQIWSPLCRNISPMIFCTWGQECRVCRQAFWPSNLDKFWIISCCCRWGIGIWIFCCKYGQPWWSISRRKMVSWTTDYHISWNDKISCIAWSPVRLFLWFSSLVLITIAKIHSYSLLLPYE